jgi:zinc protease
MMGMMASVRATLGAGLVAGTVLVAAPSLALEIQDLRSPGGAVFWLVEEPSIPIVALEISFAGGARLDPEDRAGLANLMSGLIEAGTGRAFGPVRILRRARFD